MWQATAQLLVGGGELEAYAGEIFLALLQRTGGLPSGEFADAVARAVAEEGFRIIPSGNPPDEHDISRAMHYTVSRCRALGLLVPDGRWCAHSCQLTPMGTATALEALRARAVSPQGG